MISKLNFLKRQENNLYDPIDISNLLIRKLYKKAKEKSNISYLPTNMKLQKLLYFIQGYGLKRLNKPILNAQFQAWMNGPVIPEVWHKFKYYGTGHVSISDIDLIIPSNATEEIMDYVIDKYGIYKPFELSDLTHEKNTAWSKVRKRYNIPSGEHSTQFIPNNYILDEFKYKSNPN